MDNNEEKHPVSPKSPMSLHASNIRGEIRRPRAAVCTIVGGWSAIFVLVQWLSETANPSDTSLLRLAGRRAPCAAGRDQSGPRPTRARPRSLLLLIFQVKLANVQPANLGL